MHQHDVQMNRTDFLGFPHLDDRGCIRAVCSTDTKIKCFLFGNVVVSVQTPPLEFVILLTFNK